MKKYLVLCNTHLSGFGKPVALFWGSNRGKDKSCYSSDLRDVYLFDESEIETGNYHVPIDISLLNMTPTDFKLLRSQQFPAYILKNNIIKETGIPYDIICQFEKQDDEREERAKRLGYCSDNGGICEGKDCDQYIPCGLCPANINYWDCQKDDYE